MSFRAGGGLLSDGQGVSTDGGASAERRWPWFGILLAIMILEIMVTPMMPAWEGGPRLSGIAMGLTLGAALAAIGLHVGAVILFSVAGVGIVVESFADSPAIVATSLALRTVFLAYVTVRVVWRVVSDRVITHDSVFAVACGYVLIGLTWGGLYALVETFHPGSFSIPAEWAAVRGGAVRPFTYFSLVVITTVGFGDIMPRGPTASGLCVAEAIVGQLYMAIMIARMVGILAAQRGDPGARV